MEKKDKLLIIISDYLSNIVKKGEVVSNYYNPGNIFSEVHIVMINDDQISKNTKTFEEVQKMVGTAKLFLYNLPKPSFFRTCGWLEIFMHSWIKQGIELAKKIEPNVVRTYNNFLDGYLAYMIKQELNIPYIVSLHDSTRFGTLDFKGKLKLFFLKNKIFKVMKNAEKIIAVYSSIYNYAIKYNQDNTCLLYNQVASRHIKHKNDYRINETLHILTVNRQINGKNPVNILKAIKDIDCYYTLIGDGELHEYLVNISRKYKCDNKVNFVTSKANEDICKSLYKFDLMVMHSDFLGVSKGTIEAAIGALPIILNNSKTDDFHGDWVYICDNTVASYNEAIAKFAESEELRREYGQRAYAHAQKYFNAEEIEKQTMDIYFAVMGNKR